ncbi:MAG: cbb3-type cytochrome c oxidase subunit II [Acidobacteriota bacterium]
MKMNVLIVVFGSTLIFFSVISVHLFLPWATMNDQPSDIWRARTPLEEEGRNIYVNNGCTYCHTQFIRPIDWGLGAHRVAQSGDYIADEPHLVGTERTGPDLSQEGGEHPDDWHKAHFTNPRYVRPESLMPSFRFLGEHSIEALIAYKQSLGFKMADFRTQRQKEWKKRAVEAYEAGPAENVDWIHSMVPEGWRNLPDPYPTTSEGLARGHRIYQGFCIGCHGPIGDGMGPAEPFLYPPPLNFTLLKGRGISGGILYYQIMNGITGTGMPYFKNELESAKIWDVGNYVAVYFIGETDSDAEPKGIDASFEPPGNRPYPEVLPETPPRGSAIPGQ